MALRLLRARDRVLDSLSGHAYGIYLVHYVFVLWLQYSLVGLTLNAVPKMLIVFATALVLSWGASAGASALLWARIRAPARPRRTMSHDGAVVDQMR